MGLIKFDEKELEQMLEFAKTEDRTDVVKLMVSMLDPWEITELEEWIKLYQDVIIHDVEVSDDTIHVDCGVKMYNLNKKEYDLWGQYYHGDTIEGKRTDRARLERYIREKHPEFELIWP